MEYKIKSHFVKNKIKGLKFTERNRKFIGALAKIDYLIQGESLGQVTGYMILALKDKYPKEWDAIGLELDPDHITLKQERKQELEEERRIRRELKEQERKESEEEKRFWVRNGGKL